MCLKRFHGVNFEAHFLVFVLYCKVVFILVFQYRINKPTYHYKTYAYFLRTRL